MKCIRREQAPNTSPALLKKTNTGLLRTFGRFGGLLCPGLLCGSTYHSTQAPEIRPFLHVWFADLHGEFWNSHRACGTFEIHVFRGPCIFHYYIPWKYAFDLIFNFFKGWNPGICSCFVSVRNPSAGPHLVSHQLFTRRCNGSQTGYSSYLLYAAAIVQGVLSDANLVCQCLRELFHARFIDCSIRGPLYAHSQ